MHLSNSITVTGENIISGERHHRHKYINSVGCFFRSINEASSMYAEGMAFLGQRAFVGGRRSHDRKTLDFFHSGNERW